jgi:HSP20 family protein
MRAKRVPINIYEEDGRIMVTAPIPGMEPVNIGIKVGNKRLHISTEMRGPGQTRTRQYLTQEWTTGPYKRSVNLPKPVDASRANASYDNGVLVVMLPISSAAVRGTIRMAKTGTIRGLAIGLTGHVH